MSITESNHSLVKVNDLHLSFNINKYGNTTVRDVFVNLINHPLSLLKPKDKVLVANGLNFEVKNGERLAIIGVNGTGKTSLCRCIAGIYSPNRGQVTTRGKVMAIFDPLIGIFPELSGRENAFILGQLLFPELSKKELKQLVKEALKFSELAEFIDAPFRIYSKGMQARLCLSVITARSSEILILDEIFYGADTFFQRKIELRMISSIYKSNITILVSHSEKQIKKLCTRAIVLSSGNIVFDGPPQEAWSYYLEIQSDNKSSKTI